MDKIWGLVRKWRSAERQANAMADDSKSAAMVLDLRQAELAHANFAAELQDTLEAMGYEPPEDLQR